MTEIRKAIAADIDRIAAIYEAIHTEEEQGRAVIGWSRGVYPVRKTAEDALARGDLFTALRDGKAVASAILNHAQVDGYEKGAWQAVCPDDQVMVIPTLTVDPNEKGRGIGTAFVRFYEEYARENGCRSLRLDTQEKNTAARALYARLGYKEVGYAPTVFNGIPGVRLVLLEKVIEK